MMIFMAGPIIRCQADIERTEFDLDNDEKEKTNRTLSLSVMNPIYSSVFSVRRSAHDSADLRIVVFHGPYMIFIVKCSAGMSLAIF